MCICRSIMKRNRRFTSYTNQRKFMFGLYFLYSFFFSSELFRTTLKSTQRHAFQVNVLSLTVSSSFSNCDNKVSVFRVFFDYVLVVSLSLSLFLMKSWTACPTSFVKFCTLPSWNAIFPPTPPNLHIMYTCDPFLSSFKSLLCHYPPSILNLVVTYFRL